VAKISLTADEKLIKHARQVAKQRGETLNAAFCKWLHEYASQHSGEIDALMRRLQHVCSTGPYTRDEMNAR